MAIKTKDNKAGKGGKINKKTAAKSGPKTPKIILVVFPHRAFKPKRVFRLTLWRSRRVIVQDPAINGWRPIVMLLHGPLPKDLVSPEGEEK
ncbi:uncharacterized protein GIQ15_06647 [Arthroderma uncinatum]|uniref:uncharacterized protein n=1 Tax=Arthroderma uncinatum TaxID=74035 RepID=UPI00144A9576|nr:uncharacterized protein GIQ15_06647 [Arthroderma uncinatum]KAF3479671.1 hypothetical protein GIQ15_06647 [Arthroderma uncinatum]